MRNIDVDRDEGGREEDRIIEKESERWGGKKEREKNKHIQSDEKEWPVRSKNSRHGGGK